MDDIQDVLGTFRKMMDYKYKFVVSHKKTAYIFLKKRKQGEGHCICSFFIESQREYKGIEVYWLYKSKVSLHDSTEVVLYDRLSKDATK